MSFKKPSDAFDPPRHYSPEEDDRGAVLQKGDTGPQKKPEMIERPPMPSWLKPQVTSARNVADTVVQTRGAELGTAILETVRKQVTPDDQQRLAS